MVVQTVYIHIGCNTTWIAQVPRVFTNCLNESLDIRVRRSIRGSADEISGLVLTQVPKTAKVLLESEKFKISKKSIRTT